jgi:hypothetical protein
VVPTITSADKMTSMRKPFDLHEGALVAIRTRQRNGHVVGRVVDAHQGSYLLNLHVRGTTSFSETTHEVDHGNIDNVVHVDEVLTLSGGMERLWVMADSWRSPNRAQAPRRSTDWRLPEPPKAGGNPVGLAWEAVQGDGDAVLPATWTELTPDERNTFREEVEEWLSKTKAQPHLYVNEGARASWLYELAGEYELTEQD